MIKTCIICGKEFEASSDLKKTCSHECAEENKRIRSLEYHRQKNAEKRENRKPQTVKCFYCGAEFTKISNNRKYCSVPCKKAAQKEQKAACLARRRVEKPKATGMTLAEICALAKEAGMSYGQYVRRYAV